MTIEEKVRGICSRLWDEGFIQQYKDGNVDKATQAILTLIKPMSRDKLTHIINLKVRDLTCKRRIFEMTENEIRKTVKNLKQCIVENYKDTPVRFSAVSSADIKTLLDLAEEYLKIEGWPEEGKIPKGGFSGFNSCCDYVEVETWNKALRLCKLAAMREKSKVSRGKIIQILKNQDVYLPEHYDDLATALLELINGKEA